MPHHKIAYRTEGGERIAEALRHARVGGRPEIPARGDVVELQGRRWRVTEVRLFPYTDSAIVVVTPA